MCLLLINDIFCAQKKCGHTLYPSKLSSSSCNHHHHHHHHHTSSFCHYSYYYCITRRDSKLTLKLMYIYDKRDMTVQLIPYDDDDDDDDDD